MSDGPIVILGSGQAGITVARELRKLDAAIEIALVTADDGAYYSKPSLSNALAAGKAPEQLIVTPAEKLVEQNNLHLFAQCRVSAIDAANSTLETDQGPLQYRALVLAVGANPIRLPLEGSAAADVLSVNSLQDYAVFRNRLKPGMRVAILGAGLIGCEFANDLIASGYGVRVFDIATQPLGRLLPPQAGAYLKEKLVAAGVAFEFGSRIQRVDKQGDAYRLSTDSGAQFDADLVLSAIGLAPNTALATAAGLQVNRGVVVNRLLQSSVANIYALGDCAEVGGLVLPFILPIMQAARALAKTLAGTPTEVSYPAMPVLVKTPACPTIVSPPAAGATGAWQEEMVEGGLQSLFHSTGGELLGFSLMGEATKARQALTPSLPPLL